MRFAYKTGARPLEGFTIKRGVGIGGFGEVYFAVSDAGKEVALKRVQRNLDVEVRGVSQCLNLKHPNLVSLFDLKYDDEGQAWVVMEYVSGESLRDVLERNPHGLPPEEVSRWFHGIAAAVAYLHDHGIVHRDLKPGNVFDDDGVVKVGDYGLSKFIAASRRGGQTESVGTFHYMAPEIGKGVYGKGIDVYALGIILYEMLTGRVPFEGESSQEIIMKHLTDDPDLSPLPPCYREVIRKALKKDSEQRFAGVAPMLAAVADCQGKAAEPASEPVIVLESRVQREEPIYIGEEPQQVPGDEIVFGKLRGNEVVMAKAVPPARAAQPRPVPRTTRKPSPAPRAEDKPRSSTAAKVLVALGVLLVLAVQPWLIPVAAAVGLAYLLFLGGRGWAGRAASRRNPAFAETPTWRIAARKAMRRKLFSERVAELTGSMLLAACIGAALNLVFLLFEGETLNGSVGGWSHYAWLTAITTVGAWLLLLLGKFWEGSEGDYLQKHFALLAGGLAVGLAAFAAGELLMITLPDHDRWTVHGFADAEWLRSFYASDGKPLLGAYLIYFAGLFAVLRWWAQVDPLRRSRVSLAATAVCVLWAWVMHVFCRFPQPWGLMVAASVSVAAQFSSAWLTPRDRAEIAQEVDRGREG